MTLAIFRAEGNCPLKKAILKHHLIAERCHFSGVLIFTGMLFGPDDLRESNNDIIKEISFLPVGVKKNVLVFVLDR